MRNIMAWIKVAFFFSLYWVLGSTLSMVLLDQFVARPWPFVAYFAVGIGGTV
jgi:hypothetical protein